MSEDHRPVLTKINEVKMYNPDTDTTEPIKKADFSAESDIFEADRIQQLRKEGWITRGVSAKFDYRGRIYSVTVAGNSRMGYVTVGDVENVMRGQELHDIIKERYLNNFRICPRVKDL